MKYLLFSQLSTPSKPMCQPNPTPQNLFWDVHSVCMWDGSHDGAKDHLMSKLKKWRCNVQSKTSEYV